MKLNGCLYGLLMIILVAACGRKQPKLESVTAATVAMLDTSRHTTIAWTDSIVDFGTVSEGDTVRMQFRFHNAGRQLLFITEVKPGCGCTIADYPKEPVSVGSSGIIKAEFATEWHPGKHRKLIIVRANTKPQTTHKLIFTGEVYQKSNKQSPDPPK